MSRRAERLGSWLAALVLVTSMLVLYSRGGEPPIVIGKVGELEVTGKAPKIAEPAPTSHPIQLLAAHLRWVPPEVPLDIPDKPIPSDLKFFLIIGTDARPGENVTNARADSIHIGAVDPVSRRGTILGIPRDAYVDIPGHGKRKINAATTIGGPELLVQTVRQLTGYPISYYGVTAFAGMTTVADKLGGVRIKVPYRMDDDKSGAHFEPGWHHMNGQEVLAFSRCRYGVPGGDFGRSENHGRVIKHTLEKMRAEVKDGGGIRKWLNVLFANARLDLSMGEAIELGRFALKVLPSDLMNVVAPGYSADRDGQSVVMLTDSAYALFKDIGADAVADGNTDRDPPARDPKPADPEPSPTPTPTPLLPIDLPK